MKRRRVELYRGEVVIELDPIKHVYYAERGTYVPSATGVTGLVEKDLKGWSAKLTAETAKATLLEIMRDPEQKIGIRKIQRACNDAKDEYKKYTEERADIGKDVHAWIEDYARARIEDPASTFQPPLPEDEDCRNGVFGFMEWLQKHDIEWLLAEQIVYSRQHCCAGTLDLGARITCHDNCECESRVTNQLTVVDMKTGKYVYREAGLQAAFYLMALREEDRLSIWNREDAQRGVLHINSLTGDIEYYNDAMIQKYLTRANLWRDTEVFLHLLDAYRWHANNRWAWQDRWKLKTPQQEAAS